MGMALGKIGIAVAAAVIVAGSTAALPSVAYAQYYHRGGHGWGWGGFAAGAAAGAIVGGILAAPYYAPGPVLLPGAWLLRGRLWGRSREVLHAAVQIIRSG
jgi:hypothetical protein